MHLIRALSYTYYYRPTLIRGPGRPRGLYEATVKSVIALLGCTLPSGRVVVASRNGAALRKSHRSGAQSKASSSDAPRRTILSRSIHDTWAIFARPVWWKYLSLPLFLSFVFPYTNTYTHTHTHTPSYIHTCTHTRSFSFALKCSPTSSFENARWNGAISKVADTGRAEESTASVVWPDRRAALPRDTLLKQRATLKFSEDSRRLAFSHPYGFPSLLSPPLYFPDDNEMKRRRLQFS